MPSFSQPTEDVRVRLNYLKWDDSYHEETPFQTFLPILDSDTDKRRHNIVCEEGEEELIEDVRGRESDFNIDTHGFQYFHHESVLKGSLAYDASAIRKLYLPETANFMRDNLEGADHIFIFDWWFREATMNTNVGRPIEYTGKMPRVGPTPRAHVDCTATGLLRRIERHVGGDAFKLLKGRLRMVNMWRPVGGPVVDCPLALCDGRSYPRENLIPTNQIKPAFTAQVAHALYSPGAKWYYMSRHMHNEPVLFKNFDTDEDKTPWTVHTAFFHNNIPADAPIRQSLEVRALVFTNPEGVEGQSINFVVPTKNED